MFLGICVQIFSKCTIITYFLRKKSFQHIKEEPITGKVNHVKIKKIYETNTDKYI